MSLLNRAAKHLAATDHRSQPADGTTDQAGITRRTAVKAAAGTTLALGAASMLGPFVETSYGEQYCHVLCNQQAEADWQRAVNFIELSVLGKPYLRAVPLVTVLRLEALGGALIVERVVYHAARAKCQEPNCGDPTRYPPPGSSVDCPPDYGVLCGGYCCSHQFQCCGGIQCYSATARCPGT